MPSRRTMLRWSGSLLICVATLPFVLAGLPVAQAAALRRPTLEERLLNGLRVKRPVDRAFIENVVDLVNKKILPESLVDSTFFWARARAAQRRGSFYPMAYFRFGLTARARALQIPL